MKRIFCYLLIFIVFFFQGCIKTLNEDLKAKESKLVLNSVISPDSTIKVNLSRTFNIFDDESADNLPFVNNASVGLYENNSFLFSLNFLENGYYEKADFYPTKGKEYKVRAEVHSYKNIEAKTTIPSKVEIQKIDTISVSYSDDYGDSRQYYGEITYQDISGEENHYQLKCRVLAPNGNEGEKEWYDQSIWVEESNEVLFDKTYGKLLWTDKYSDGKKIKFRFSFFELYGSSRETKEANDTLSFEFSLMSVDKEYYLYLKTMAKYEETSGGSDPFMEPVVIYSNVDEGYGVFGAYQQDTTSVFIITQYSGDGGEE